ncbi:hypothetical protein [Amycolatopsis sp. H20-H5]|uniref:hypothetical protein n=1 Tax=Amycolatopsis sp. H20-H5 TaxID=3046309 RepID=UPI002DBDA764|nr:hypothetical protein [Amycolatopsis sp. H20-H5]MEC3982395.1 hypothetical protein [Amycolatopsis sp. H20-H5]
MTTPSWVHVLALIKGAAESTSDVHFGSLMGFDSHARVAVALGLVEDLRGESGADDRDDDIVVTAAGWSFYHEFELERLPAGRANNWPRLAEELVESAEAALQEHWNRIVSP